MKTVTLLILSAISVAQSQPASDSAETSIRAVRESSNAAIRNHDIHAFATTLADDFVMIRGNGSFVPSRQAYLDLFAADFTDSKSVRYERIPDKIELSSASPLAAEHGHWIGTRLNGTKAYGGTYLAMWRQTESGWKIRSELFVVLACYDAAACAGYRK
jgi:ketosteroid isomerase-like protein